jgi:hypothetical protein
MRLCFIQRLLVGLLLAGLSFFSGGELVAAVSEPGLGSVASHALNGLPLYFEPSSQVGNPVAFSARGRNYQFLLGPGTAEIRLARTRAGGDTAPNPREAVARSFKPEIHAVRMHLVGANPFADISGQRPVSAKVNYLTGADESAWRSNVPVYEQVCVRSVYPGIDLVYYGNQQRLEYDFNVGPGVDPQQILIRFEGADALTVNEAGELVVELGGEKLIQHRPIIYQEIGDERKAISGGYVVVGKYCVGFNVGRHRQDLPLVIDPVLAYSSYFGGTSGDIGLTIKLDAAGAIYIGGETLSHQFPFTIPTNAFQRTFKGGSVDGDGFVAKFDASGSNLVYFTYLGGKSDDGVLDLAVDAQGNVYVTGLTSSTNFPTKNALYRKIHGTADPNIGAYPTDGFVSKLNPDGSGLVFSTYFGGDGADLCAGIAVDPAGNVYVTGYTHSLNFPTFHPYYRGTKLAGGNDGFVAKFGSAGTNLIYSTYLGGSQNDEGQGVAADAEGCAYVTGYTGSFNFPLTNSYQLLNGYSTSTTYYDAFLAKFAPDGSVLYATPFGGYGNDYGYRIVLDSRTNALLTGIAQAHDFPNTVTNLAALPYPTNSYSRGFLASFGSRSFLLPVTNDSVVTLQTNFYPALNFSAVFGGAYGDSSGWDLAVDSFDDVFVTGVTTAKSFVSYNASGFLSATNSGRKDAFVIAFQANASSLLYSAMLGGAADDQGYGIAVNPGGEAFILGRSLSANFPTVNALQTNRQGSSDCFLAIVSPEPRLTETFNNGVLQLQWWAGQGAVYVLEEAPAPGGPWSLVTGQPVRPSGWTNFSVPTNSTASFFRLRRL